MSTNRANRRRSDKRDAKLAVRQLRDESAATWTPFERSTDGVDSVTGKTFPVSQLGFDEIWANNRYVVMMRFAPPDPMMGQCVHLSIRRRDRGAARDWRDLQRIKNELMGPEAEAVELYPAESRLVDAANQFHLWVFPDYRFQFGFKERDVRGPDDSMFGATQRPFNQVTP